MSEKSESYSEYQLDKLFKTAAKNFGTAMEELLIDTTQDDLDKIIDEFGKNDRSKEVNKCMNL